MKKDIIEALLKIGFKQPYTNYPDKLVYEGYSLQITDCDTLDSVFRKIFKAGQTIKIWEVKRVLEVN